MSIDDFSKRAFRVEGGGIYRLYMFRYRLVSIYTLSRFNENPLKSTLTVNSKGRS